MSEQAEARYVDGKYVKETDYVAPRRSRYTADGTWTTKKAFPTGRLCLQAYSPYRRAKWVHHWRETKDRDLSSRISAIVKDLEHTVVDVSRLIEEGERQAVLEQQRWIVQQEEWRREELERRTVQAFKDSKKDLLQIIDAWAEASRIEQFFAEAETRIADLSDDQRARLAARLKLGHELVGSTDALGRFMRWRSPDERLRTSENGFDDEGDEEQEEDS